MWTDAIGPATGRSRRSLLSTTQGQTHAKGFQATITALGTQAHFHRWLRLYLTKALAIERAGDVQFSPRSVLYPKGYGAKIVGDFLTENFFELSRWVLGHAVRLFLRDGKIYK